MGEQINGLRERLTRCLDGVIDQDVIDNILFCFDRACGFAKKEGRQAGLKIAIDRLVKQKSENGEVDVRQEIIALYEHFYDEGGEFELERKLIESQIAYMDARVAAMNSQETLISISADGLEPELEAFMHRILERIKTVVSAEQDSDPDPDLLPVALDDTGKAECISPFRPGAVIPLKANRDPVSDFELEILRLQLELIIKKRTIAKMAGLHPDDEDNDGAQEE